MYKCTNVQMYKCTNVQMYKCTNVPIQSLQLGYNLGMVNASSLATNLAVANTNLMYNIKTKNCANMQIYKAQLYSCINLQRNKCANVQMYLQK